MESTAGSKTETREHLGNRLMSNLPQSVKVGSDVGVWGVAAIGWLGILQPWLTALATLLAVTWTSIQLYEWYKKKGK